VNRTGSRVEQADKALAEPFKHADALKAAQTDSARIDQLMAGAAKREESPVELDPPHGGCPVPGLRSSSDFAGISTTGAAIAAAGYGARMVQVGCPPSAVGVRAH
jgi:hypothetical protein